RVEIWMASAGRDDWVRVDQFHRTDGRAQRPCRCSSFHAGVHPAHADTTVHRTLRGSRARHAGDVRHRIVARAGVCVRASLVLVATQTLSLVFTAAVAIAAAASTYNPS